MGDLIWSDEKEKDGLENEKSKKHDSKEKRIEDLEKAKVSIDKLIELEGKSMTSKVLVKKTHSFFKCLSIICVNQDQMFTPRTLHIPAASKH